LILDQSLEFVSELLGELRGAGYLPISLRVSSLESLGLALDDAGWDLVIADYSMPGFLAAGALELIRAKGLDVPLILVSANLAQDVALVALKAGVGDYLPKAQLRWIGPAVERTLREAGERRGRLRAEEALRAGANPKEALPTPSLSVVCDPRGSVLACSADLVDLLGYRREEVLGRNWVQDFLAPQERARAREAFLRALTAASRGELQEYHLVAFDGTLRAVRWQSSVLVDAAGETLGVASVGVALPRGIGPNDTVRNPLGRLLGAELPGPPP
jgi:PAS domain S-box-containing protein